MRKRLHYTLSLLITLLFTLSLYGQDCCDVDTDVDLCFLSGADYCGSNLGSCFAYSLDGNWMVNALAAKLNSPNNFGVDGIVECELDVKELQDVSSVMAINDAECDMIFLPNVFVDPITLTQNLDSSFIPEAVLQTIYDWSLLCDNNLVIATQAEANLWGYKVENANVNPNTPVAGTSLFTIFDGPFGSLDFFDQGGTYQGVFTETPATGHEILGHDANMNTTIALDLASNDLIIGDIGIFCSGGAGVVSAGPNVINNNDILVCNIFAVACQLVEESSSSSVFYELCPGDFITLPDGTVVDTPGTYLDTLVSVSGCDSIVTTSLSFGIDQAPVLDVDTIICLYDTITLDGTLPYTLPQPVFTNSETIFIAPALVNVISTIQVSGFGSELISPDNFESICLNIDHNWVDDLDILLVAPNGDYVELTSDNGLNGDDYTGTCFTVNATTPITDASAMPPFTGDWLPEGPWSDIYGGPVNGVWQLILRDDSNGFTGSLLDWTLTFQPALDISYDWQSSVGLSCDTCPITQAYPSLDMTYYLTISDNYGCSIQDSVEILVEDILPPPMALCDSINLNFISVAWDSVPGAIGYEINVDGSGWTTPNNGSFMHNIPGLSPLDTLLILVRSFDDCAGEIDSLFCSTPACNAPQPSIDLVVATSCYGTMDGALAVSATGGSGSMYTFDLDGTINMSGAFSGLESGTYQVIVTDDQNCSNSIEVVVPQPDSLVLTPLVVDSIDCFGNLTGAVTAIVQNGVVPLNFVWNGLAGDSVLTSLGIGSYSVLVTDANGCMGEASIDLSQPSALALSTDSIPVSCFAGSDGEAMVNASGGTMPYAYQWDNNANNQITATASSLSAGSYMVTVTDDNGCSLETNVLVSEPSALTLDLTGTDPSCFGYADGVASATVTGGVPEYTYSWNVITIPDTSQAGGLTFGSYAVTVTDDNGCTITASTNLNNPVEITLMAQGEDVLCNGGNTGSIVVQPNGAIGNVSYLWDNGAMSADNQALIAGTYCVTVTDDNDCEATLCETITEPSPIVLSLQPEPVGCDEQGTGIINLTVEGGSMPYNYDWSNGAQTQNIENLDVNVYTVTVTDDNGCEAMASGSVIQLNPTFSIGLEAHDALCNGESSGMIDLVIVGGIDGPTYEWQGPNGFQSNAENISNLAAGSYFVTVTDEAGCAIEGTTMVDEPTPINATFNVIEVSCFGLADGSISVEANGGTGPYVYAFDGGNQFQTFPSTLRLTAGNYDVVIQDANGCEFSQSVDVPEPPEIIITLDPLIEICLGESHFYHAQINVPTGSISQISWFPPYDLSCSDCLAPEASPAFSTPYVLQIEVDNGCMAIARSQLKVDRQPRVFVPNVFSPNGDGNNELVFVSAKTPSIRQITKFYIFDRWGEQVFAATNFLPNDPAIGWDGTLHGTLMNPGVYAWYVEVELLDGELAFLQGSVTLVR